MTRHKDADALSPEAKRAITVAILGVMCAQLLINIVSVALGTIARETGASTGGLQWVQSIYILGMTASVLSAGVIAANVGRCKVMVSALWLVAAGSALDAVSALLGDAALWALWAGQAIAGVGGGALLPTTLATISVVVTKPRLRGKYIAYWGAGTTFGLAVGGFVSGAILKAGLWGLIFLPAVLTAAAIAVYARRALPEDEVARPGMDIVGQVLATVAIVAFIFGAIEGGALGWTDAVPLTGFGIGLVVLVAFIVYELRTPRPLLNLKMFAHPGFSAAGFAAFISLFSVVGIGFLLSLFLSLTRNLDAFGVATYVCMIPLSAFIVAPVIGRVLGSIPPTAALTAGLLIAGVSTFFLAQATPEMGYLSLLWRMFIYGIGIAMMFASLATVAVSSVPPQEAPMAGAANTVLRQAGGALGPAVAGSIFAATMAGGGTPTEGFQSAVTVTTVLLLVAAVFVVLGGWAYTPRTMTRRTP